MTKQEFIEKATEYGYAKESIERFIEFVKEYEDIRFEDIFLAKVIVN